MATEFDEDRKAYPTAHSAAPQGQPADKKSFQLGLSVVAIACFLVSLYLLVTRVFGVSLVSNNPDYRALTPSQKASLPAGLQKRIQLIEQK